MTAFIWATATSSFVAPSLKRAPHGSCGYVDVDRVGRRQRLAALRLPGPELHHLGAVDLVLRVDQQLLAPSRGAGAARDSVKGGATPPSSGSAPDVPFARWHFTQLKASKSAFASSRGLCHGDRHALHVHRDGLRVRACRRAARPRSRSRAGPCGRRARGSSRPAPRPPRRRAGTAACAGSPAAAGRAGAFRNLKSQSARVRLPWP